MSPSVPEEPTITGSDARPGSRRPTPTGRGNPEDLPPATDADPGPSPRLAALVAAIGIVAFTWPALPKLGSALLGHPFGEVDNHFWMATFGGRADAPARNLPVGFDLPLMDPIHLLWWVPAGLFGPVSAYNAAALGDLALAALGGWVLARELGASRAGALVGMVATAFSPFLAGMIEFGITEAWPVGWLALHAALLLRFGRTGALRDLVGASAALGALLLSGWYHAAFALVAEVGLGVWALARGPRLRTAVGIVAQGVVASLPIVPLWVATQERAAIWAPRLSALTRPQRYTDWAQNPRFGTDLLNFVTPRPEELDVSRTVYLGVVVIGLAFVGATRRRGAAALACAAPLLVLALGHWLRIAGEPVSGMGPLPAGWLAANVDAARGLSHWYRAAGPATVFLAAAAALGATRLVAGVARLAPRVGSVGGGLVVSALVFADAVALAPVPWPRVTYAPNPPPALLDLPKPGALLQVPFDEGRGLPDIASRRVYDQWQVFHGRGITEHYEGRDALVYGNPTVAGWQRACAGIAPLLPMVRKPVEDLALLREAGVAYVVVHPEHAKGGCATEVGRRLGAPVARTPRAVVWDLADAIARLRAEERGP